MRIGVALPFSTSDGHDGAITWRYVRDFATHAEALGFDSVWICDHFWSEPPDGQLEGILEAWTIQSALAAVTSHVELGQLVMCTAFRNPALLAKMAVTADEVSGGRLTLGLGAGWYDREFAAFGYPTDRRAARFEAALETIAALLSGDDARLLPPPSRRIPILVAAERRRMLRLTARHAQGWNTAWYPVPDGRLSRRIEAMSAALAAEGRDPASLRRTVGVEAEGPNAEDLARRLDAFERLGFDDAIVGLVPRNRRSLDVLAAARELSTR